MSFAACGVEDVKDVDDTSDVESWIHGEDALATQSHANRAVAVGFFRSDGTYKRTCTGTFIEDNHVLTAAHCATGVGYKVAFFTTPNQIDTGRIRTVTGVAVPSGVSAAAEDYIDTAGNWADVAVLELNATAGAPAVIAALDWTAATAGTLGTKVGAGRRGEFDDEDPNEIGQLRRINDTVYESSSDDGYFVSTSDTVNKGDSGGPFYTPTNGVGLWVSGVLAQWVTVDGGRRNRYTDVPKHLSWILDAMDYHWVGGTTQAGKLTGTLGPVYLLGLSQNLCKYICERTTDCAGFNYAIGLGSCQILTSVTGTTATSGWISDLKP